VLVLRLHGIVFRVGKRVAALGVGDSRLAVRHLRLVVAYHDAGNDGPVRLNAYSGDKLLLDGKGEDGLESVSPAPVTTRPSLRMSPDESCAEEAIRHEP
jgi:hypothetical protein